jgi:tRNA (guanine-N7-)-methyltransferase
MEHTPEIELTCAKLAPPICWQQVFGNSAPVSLEIGFGKGSFLLSIAPQRPTVNFLGIESSRKYYRKGSRKLQRSGLSNIKLVWGEAAHFLKRYTPDESIRTVYINFPDPWPKRRHAKRRLLKPEFVMILARKLEAGGRVEIATDVAEYSVQIQDVFRANERYEMLTCYMSNSHGSTRAYQSDYERMFLQEGKTIHYITYMKAG